VVVINGEQFIVVHHRTGGLRQVLIRQLRALLALEAFLETTVND